MGLYKGFLVSPVTLLLLVSLSACGGWQRPASKPLTTAPTSERAPEGDLGTLRQSTVESLPAVTLAMPKSGHFYPNVIPPSGLLWLSGDTQSGYLLKLVSPTDESTRWNFLFDRSSPVFDGLAESLVAYTPRDGLSFLQWSSGKEDISLPPVGPASLAHGGSGRVYLVPMGEQVDKFYVAQIPSKGYQTISVPQFFRSFAAARESDSVLVACPNVRLLSGSNQMWEYDVPTCPGNLGVSDDGTVAYAIFYTDQHHATLRVFGSGGNVIWEWPHDPTAETVVFSSAGKRFWIRQKGPAEKPLLRLADASGKTLGQWSFTSKWDNVWGANDAGTRALLIVENDILVLNDDGKLLMRYPWGGTVPVLAESQHAVYVIDDANHRTLKFSLLQP